MHLNKQLHSWHQFKDQFIQRFGPSLYRDLRGEIAKLQQKITVHNFYNEFEELANQISRIPPEFLQSCFESGLRHDIKREVRALQSNSLQQAFQLTKLIEDRLTDEVYAARTSRFIPPVAMKQQAPLLPTLVMSNNNSNNQNKSQIPIQRLTATQLEDRKRKGLCFNCDEKFHRGHAYKSKLFALMVVNEEQIYYL